MSSSDTLDMEAGEKNQPVIREGDPQPGRLRWVVQPAAAGLAIVGCVVYANSIELTNKQSLLQNDALLQVSDERLRKAVRMVGTRVSSVSAYLAK